MAVEGKAVVMDVDRRAASSKHVVEEAATADRVNTVQDGDRRM